MSPVAEVVTNFALGGAGAPAFPTPPINALALGCVNGLFNAPFQSPGEIDSGDTGNAGYKFYVRRSWPLCAQTTYWQGNPSTDPSTFSVANGVLSFSGFTDGPTTPSGYCLGSACPSGSGYVGTVVSGKNYVRFPMRVDPSTFNGGDSWDVSWLAAMEFLLGAQSWPEDDVVEYFHTNPPDSTVHDWTISGTTVLKENTNTNTDLGAFFTPDNGWHNYDRYICPSQLNGGTGIRQIFVDDVHIPQLDVTWSPTGPASPGATPSNPNGTFSLFDTQHYMIILGSGVSGNNAQFGPITAWGG